MKKINLSMLLSVFLIVTFIAVPLWIAGWDMIYLYHALMSLFFVYWGFILTSLLCTCALAFLMILLALALVGYIRNPPLPVIIRH
jgi:hypothetical protein